MEKRTLIFVGCLILLSLFTFAPIIAFYEFERIFKELSYLAFAHTFKELTALVISPSTCLIASDWIFRFPLQPSSSFFIEVDCRRINQMII